MRAEFERLSRDDPKAPAWRDPGFTGHPVARLMRNELPDALKRALPTLLAPHVVDGSAGDGSWTHTPWVAVLDPKVTTTVQEGVYVVYLLSLGGERLYLTLNQGCTRLKDGPAGIPGARQELVRRREMIWRRLQPSANRLRPISVDSNVERRVWRGKLYELGAVAGVEYPASALPSELARRGAPPVAGETVGRMIGTGGARPLRFWWSRTPSSNLARGLLRTCEW